MTKDNFGFVPDEDFGFVPDKMVSVDTAVIPDKDLLESNLQTEKRQIEQFKVDRLAQARKEESFKKWYADIAEVNKLNPDPDDPQHFYDYRSYFDAFSTGRAQPPQYIPEHKQFRMPDEFKLPGHPGYYTTQDPNTWTLEQTQQFIKDHPARTLEEEAKLGILLDKKKKENKIVREIPQIIAARERSYQRPLTGEEQAQAVVDLVNKEHGIKPGLGTKVERAVTGPEAQAVTRSVLFPEYTVLQGARGALDATGQYDLLDRIKRGILEPEKTKKLYEHLKVAEDLPKWAKITADIAEDFAALGMMGLAKGAIKEELVRRNVMRKLDQAATQFAEENTANFMPAGWKAEEAFRAELKNDFINRLLSRVTAPEIEGGVAGTLGKLEAGIEPSILEKYIQKQSSLKLIVDEVRSLGKSGEIPLLRHYSIENGIIKPSAALKEAAEMIRAVSIPKQKILDTMVRAAALEAGAHLIPGSENTPVEDRAKSAKSIALKVARKQAEGNTDFGIGDIPDHARNAILVNTWKDIPAVFQSLASKAQFIGDIFMVQSHASGYRGIFLKTDLGEGIGGEIQIHNDASWKLKKETDLVYREWRDKVISELPVEQQEKIKQLARETYKKYEDFYLGETGGSLNSFEDFIKRSASEAGISFESKKLPVATAGVTQALSAGEKAKIPGPSDLKSIPESERLKAERIVTSEKRLPQEKGFVKEEIPPENNLEFQYDQFSPEEQAKFDLEMDDLRKTPEGNLFVAILKLGGVKSYGKGFLKEEMGGIPLYLRNNQGLALDELISDLKEYGWHFGSTDELQAAINNQAATPVVKVDRAALRQIIKEAEKNKALQAEIAARMGKRRKFITTVKEAEKTAPEVAQKIESRYGPITNAETIKQAQAYVKDKYNDAVELVEGTSRTSTFSNAVGIVLIDKAQAEGRFADAIRLVETIARKNTELGQAIQALAMYARLTPEGILQYAERQVRKAREDVPQRERITNFEKLSKGKTPKEIEELADKLKIPHISEIVAKQLRNMAQNLQKMPAIEDWPDFKDVPPRWAYQFVLDIDKQLQDAGEAIHPEVRNAIQFMIDAFKKAGVTGENVPWTREDQLAFEAFRKGRGITGENVPWTKETQDAWNIGVGRMSRARQIETALMLKKISDQIPLGLGKKISMLQTMAQLLNPKTFIRNILGNVGFMGMENISETFATALDIATALVTGKRTVRLPMPGVQAKGLAQGMKEGTQEALLGINLRYMGQKFDLPRNGVFDTGVLGALEKTMGVSLKATDQAFYQAAYNQSIRQQCLLAGVEDPTPEMIERAHLEGLYRTFQDDNVISRLFVNIKRALNLQKDFGLGDIVLKYPKTPGNLLARGIEYSPFGFAKTCVLLTKGLLKKEFNQEDFVRSTARAFSGSALLVGTGAILAALGIISGKRDKDKDVRAAQKEAGLGEYQINVDALKRFTLSGLNADQARLQEGDTLVSYDWFLPSSIGLALGANMVLNKDRNIVDRTLNLAERVMEASETLAEQPVVRGIKVLTSKEKISEGLADTLKDVPASFVPTLLNQIRQLTDNTARNLRDPNFFTEVGKKVAYRIPGLSGKLPPVITPLGEEKELYQEGSNNPFNVLINPAFVSKYRMDPVTRMVLEIYETTGETIHFPRVAQAKIKLGSDTPEPMELTPAQYTEYQRYIGTRTRTLFSILSDNEKFMDLTDDIKAKKLQGYLTDINTAAKIEVLGYRPKKVPHDVITIIKAIGSNKQLIDAVPDEDLGFVPE